MILNYEVIKNWYATQDFINDKIAEIAKKIVKLDERIDLDKPSQGNIKTNWNVSSWEIEQEETKVILHEWWAYGGSDSHYISFPTKYLFDYDYEPELILQKEKREEEYKIIAEEKKKKEEEKDKNDYLKLKEKFGNHECT